MARSLDQITAELNKYTDQTRQNVLSQLAELPAQQKAQEAGLNAQVEGKFGDILAGARRRGLGFSGIPLAEQSKYLATDYAPALARNAAQFSERRMTLNDALNNLDRQNYLQANDIYNQELQREEQKRQFDLGYALQQQQASAAPAQQQSLASLFNGGGSQPSMPQVANSSRKQDGGFSFTDSAGQPISAAKYAQLTGQDIRDVLYSMGEQGDQYARQVYNQLATDPVFKSGDSNYLTQIKQLYSPLFWGT